MFNHDSYPSDVTEASIYQIETLVSPITRRRDDPGGIEKDHQQAGGSRQIADDHRILPSFSSDVDVIPPPIDLRLWASQLARSTRLNRGVRTIARNTVGLGWDIVPREKVTHETTAAELKSIAEEAARVRAFFEGLNPDQPFNSLMECEVIDEEATGNGYLEFTRTGAGLLDKVFHVMSTTMRLLRDDRGYVQERGGKRIFFKKFGDERTMHAETGRFSDEEGFAETGRRDNNSPNGDGLLRPDQRATEILHFKLYHPMSEHYGLPRFISAGAAVAGNFHSARRNVSFFQNDAVPRMAVLVSGGQLDSESKKEITKMFQEGQGADQAHRVLVLQATTEGVGVDDKNTTKLELKPLTVNSTEDGSFLNYRRENNEEIRESLGLSEVYFKSEKLTKASAVVAKATTDEQEFEPARILKEHIINHKIVWAELDATRVRFQFRRPETSDPLEKATVAQLYANTGVVTPNEVRATIGKEPFPAEEPWADVPFPVGILAMQGTVTEHSSLAVEPEKPEAQPVAPAAASGDGSGDAGKEPEDSNKSIDELANVSKTVKADFAPPSFVGKVAERIRCLPEALPSGKT